MARRFRNFDAFDAEQRAEPIKFRLAGREWEAVNANDAATFLRFVKQASHVEQSFDAMAQYLEDMLAVEDRVPFAEALRTHSIQVRTIREIVVWVFLQAAGLPLAEEPALPKSRSRRGKQSRVVSLFTPSTSEASASAAS